MKILFAIISLLVISASTNAQTKEFVVYQWEELPLSYDADTIYALDLSRLRLDSVPELLSQFHHLRYLNLGKNKLKELPDFIGEMNHLEELNLEKNRFEVVPMEFCKLSNLRRLILSRNAIERLPSCVEYLNNLEYIDLYDTPMADLPEGMVRMKNLKKVDLTGIRFSPDFQEKWIKLLPEVELVFDAPCDCMSN